MSQGARYATASDDGATVAVAFDDEVAIVRGAVVAERVAGWLAPASSPLIARGELLRDVARAVGYRVTGDLDGLWRATARGLLHVVSSPRLDGATLALYAPDDPSPRWQVGLDAGVLDVAIAGERAIAQLGDGRARAALVAVDLRDGAVAWRVDTPATCFDQGAVVRGAGVVATVLADRDRGETCEQVVLHEVATGARLRAVGLRGPAILVRLGRRGVETALGIAGDELWFRFHQRSGGRDSARAAATTYDVFDLIRGAARRAAPPWEAALAISEPPILLAPIDGGLVSVRADRAGAEVRRWSRAP